MGFIDPEVVTGEVDADRPEGCVLQHRLVKCIADGDRSQLDIGRSFDHRLVDAADLLEPGLGGDGGRVGLAGALVDAFYYDGLVAVSRSLRGTVEPVVVVVEVIDVAALFPIKDKAEGESFPGEVVDEAGLEVR